VEYDVWAKLVDSLLQGIFVPDITLKIFNSVGEVQRF
jgi:hypothetical protein